MCPRVGYQIGFESYTDNILLGSHEGLDDLTKMMEIAEKGLGRANMHLKDWAITGSRGQEVEFKLSDTGALGLYWDPLEDIMKIRLKVNLGSKKRNLRDENCALNSHKDIDQFLEKNKVTKRILLRI